MIMYISPLRKRSTYAGIGAATEAAASLIAPLLGGLLTDRLSWRWCFFIQLSLIIALIAIMVSFLDISVGKVDGQTTMSVLRRLDVKGTAIFVPAISLLLLALRGGAINMNGQIGASSCRCVSLPPYSLFLSGTKGA